MQQVCKCCGRTMEVSETAYTATCHFCGKQQTLPPCHTPKLRKQYAQIYALRQSGAFSAAIEQIEHLLHLYPEESEWYWQRLLCRYGMVYLPDIGKKPLNHRQFQFLRLQLFQVFLHFQWLHQQ